MLIVDDGWSLGGGGKQEALWTTKGQMTDQDFEKKSVIEKLLSPCSPPFVMAFLLLVPPPSFLLLPPLLLPLPRAWLTVRGY